MDPVSSFRSCEPGDTRLRRLNIAGGVLGAVPHLHCSNWDLGNRYSADILYKKLRAENRDFRYHSE